MRPRSADCSASPQLDAAGFTAVVATNLEQEYLRYLRPGDLVTQQVFLEEVSEEKRTALGAGHFLNYRYEFTDQDGALVGRMRFRILKFRPAPQAEQAAVAAAAETGPPAAGDHARHRIFLGGAERAPPADSPLHALPAPAPSARAAVPAVSVERLGGAADERSRDHPQLRDRASAAACRDSAIRCPWRWWSSRRACGSSPTCPA